MAIGKYWESRAVGEQLGGGGGTPGFILSITPWLVEGWGGGSVDMEVEDGEGCGGEGHNSYPVKLSDNHQEEIFSLNAPKISNYFSPVI